MDSTESNSPTNQLMAVVANLEENLSGADNAETLDLTHFTYRVKVVLDALGQPKPDVFLLQEVNEQTAQRVADMLSNRLNADYRVGAVPAAGTGANVRPLDADAGISRIRREAAVLYNNQTVTAPTSVTWVSFAYGKAAHVPCVVGPADPDCDEPYQGWTTLEAPIARVIERSSNKPFAVSSVHFVPDSRLQSPEWYKTFWSDKLKQAITDNYPNATPIVGGDLNHQPCVASGAQVGDANCDEAAELTNTWKTWTQEAPAYVASRDGGIDHLFTRGRVVSANSDYDYKNYPTQFASPAEFLKCNALYKTGDGDSAAAKLIQDCYERYYSDHAYFWALVATT